MVGKAHKSALLVVTDRTTLPTALEKVTSRKAKEIAKKIIARLGRIPTGFIKTLIFDNDKAFAKHQKIAKKLKADTYFTRPYTSQDKGTVFRSSGGSSPRGPIFEMYPTSASKPSNDTSTFVLYENLITLIYSTISKNTALLHLSLEPRYI